MNTKILSIVAGIAAGTATMLTATSCGIYGKYSVPSDNAAAVAWADAHNAEQDSTALGNLPWQQVFTDPVLADLIERALANNTSLKDANANVGIARAQLKGARLAFLPSLAIAPSGQGASVAGSDITWTYQLPASASWEIDAFGKLLNNKRSAAVAVETAAAYRQATRSGIIAAVANTYYAIAATQAQLDISRNTARLWQETVVKMRDLKESGRLTEAAVVQADANYRAVLASVTSLEVARHKLDNTMSLLLNTMPQHFEVAPDASLTLPAAVANGVPMQLLAQRPDVLAAERGMASAFYTTASARAAFYPSLTITANGGFTNQLGALVKNPGEWFYNLGASLVAPLFSRGQNIARLEAAKLSQQKALNAFENTLFNAAGEVSNALTVYEKAGERATHLDQQVADLEKSVEYTNDLMVYSNGTYLEVLTAQQSLLQAQINVISCRLDRQQAVISLYQTTGGGR